MECCINVSTETILQLIVTFYTIMKRILKLTFQTVVLYVGVNSLQQRNTVQNVSFKILFTMV